MTTRGDAYALALAIYAGTDGPVVDIDDLADRVYRTLDRTPLGCDDAKADLYAQLAERLTAETTFQSAVDIIQMAMNETLAAIPGGLHGTPQG